MLQTAQKLVETHKGLLNRKIFVDQEIYQQELEQVFGRCWLFVGHESQIPMPNDFTANYMGEDPILVTRDMKGRLHAFLNMCRHRGNRICRADSGNAPSFMCTYHGWTFATDGKLVGVPGYKEAYFEELDRSQWGLVDAGRIDSYKGLIFATWDKQAPSLLDYLGDMTFYMDMVLDRREGGTEVLGGIHRWVMNANWKFPSDNFGGDGYHTYLTHGSMRVVRGGNAGALSSQKYGEGGWQVNAGNGHGAVRFGGGGYGKRTASSPEPTDIVTKYFVEHLPEVRQRLGEMRATNAGTAGVWTAFPNVSYHSSPFIRLWHPRGPEKTEIWSLCLVDKAAPSAVKDALRKNLTTVFGPAGGFDMDDMNNFIQSTSVAKGVMGPRYALNQQLGVGHEGSIEGIPGRTQSNPSELNQRSFYQRWAEIMDAPSWKDIKLAPRTFK